MSGTIAEAQNAGNIGNISKFCNEVVGCLRRLNADHGLIQRFLKYNGLEKLICVSVLLLISGCDLDEQKPGITISPTSGLQTSEDQQPAKFDIVLDAKPDAAVTIAMSSSNTSEGVLSTTSVVFSPGDWSSAKTVTITGVDDDLQDGDVGYRVVFQPSLSGDKRYNNKSISSLAVVNLDNELPQNPKPAAGVTVAPTSDLSTSENQTSTNFSVVLNSQPSSDVVISATSTNLIEGVVTPSSVTFNSDNWSTAVSFTVTGVDDTIVDGTQDYSITLAAQSTDTDYDDITIASVSLQNLDNDAITPSEPGFTISPSSGLITAENQSEATFSVSLNSAPSADVVVNLSSSNSNEGTVAPDSLTFTSVDWNTAQSVSITGVDDAVMDGTVVYTVDFSIQSADSDYNGITVSSVSAQNQDNDTADITVAPSSGLITSEDLASDTFSIVLTSQPTAHVTIGLNSSDTTEATVSPSNVIFTAADWNTARTVTLSGVDDTIADGNVAYEISFSVTSGDSNYNEFTLNPVEATNQDNDSLPPAGVTVTPTADLITSETLTSDTFTVVLDSQPTGNVIISLASDDTTEGTVSPATLTFITGNWNSAQTVTITGVDDDIADGSVDYNITFSVQSADTNYNEISVTTVSVTNQNNDTVGVNVSPTSGLTTTEAQTTDSFSVSLNSQPTADVTISLTSSDTGEGTVAPTPITFNTGNWNSAQTVTVTGVDDATADGNIPYTVNFSVQSSDTNYNNLTVNPVSVTNQDNEPAQPDYVLYIEPGSIDIAASTISGAGATTLPAMGFSLTAAPAGKTPGPVIEAVVGQTTTVEVVNDHLNTHRFEIEQWLTGTADLQPGETRQFQFTPTEAGVYRYGDPQLLHRAIGLHGAVVVRPSDDPKTAWTGGPAFEQERTWVISDFDQTWLESPSAVDLAQYNPNYFLLNGKSGFAANQDPASTIEGNVGETFLIRILNAGQYDQSLHFHSNHFQVISEGGFKYTDLLSAPTVSTINVKRSSSAMVLFTLTQAGTFPVHVHTAQMETGNGVHLNGTVTFIIGN